MSLLVIILINLSKITFYLQVMQAFGFNSTQYFIDQLKKSKVHTHTANLAEVVRAIRLAYQSRGHLHHHQHRHQLRVNIRRNHHRNRHAKSQNFGLMVFNKLFHRLRVS